MSPDVGKYGLKDCRNFIEFGLVVKIFKINIFKNSYWTGKKKTKKTVRQECEIVSTA